LWARESLIAAFSNTKHVKSNTEVRLKINAATTNENEIIKLEDVSTVYEGARRTAIKHVNLTLKRNELVYVVGPNAAGKTTLLETINGMLPTFKGKVTVFGLNVKTHGRQVRCGIGYVPQDFMVKPGEPYTALDVVLMGRYGQIGFLHQPSAEDKAGAREAMRLIGIEELADRAMGKLSGGQQQKVMLARALAKKPKILLLDEPFSNLDPDSRGQIPMLITKLHQEKGLTTLIVTHDIHHMLDQCTRVLVVSGGRVTFDGTPEKALNLVENHPHTTSLETHHH
jgi:zinc/manganese transport system ATP-binding protein